MNQGPMAESAGMGPPETAEPKPKPNSEYASVFIPKESLGDRTVKAGDTITLTVRDVDPDSGEVEACVEGGPETASEHPGYEEGIDNLPDESEES